jgi:tRNA(fMet)-specific endonuclease VapC
MEAAVVDTTLLIDLQRGRQNPDRLDGERWLSAHPRVVLKIPSVVLGEFATGFEDPAAPVITELRHRHEILAVGPEEAIRYARLFRAMKRTGTLIGGNDLWIAATALEANLPLVTRNGGHFDRVEGLQVVTY